MNIDPNKTQDNSVKFIPLLKQRIIEAVKWFGRTGEPLSIPQLRSEQFKPERELGAILDLPEIKSIENYDERSMKASTLFMETVETVAQKRKAAVKNLSFDQSAIAQTKGLLVIYFPENNLTDGMAMESSDGLYDIYDSPPWDSYLCLSEPTRGRFSKLRKLLNRLKILKSRNDFWFTCCSRVYCWLPEKYVKQIKHGMLCMAVNAVIPITPHPATINEALDIFKDFRKKLEIDWS